MTFMITALSRAISFKEIALATKDRDMGYVQRLDHGAPYTDGEAVIFEIRRKKLK